MRVLGIDPGYAIVGYGALDAPGATDIRCLTYGAVTTPAHTPLPARLCEVYDDVCALLDTLKPDAMAIETLFFTNNKTTGIAVAEARGVILLAAHKAGVPIFEYTPVQVKQGVSGYGKATKRQVQEMTQRLLHLPGIPKPDDAADALAIALCHAHSATSLFGRGDTKLKQMGYY